MNQAEIEKVVDERYGVSPSGLSAVFVKLSDNWGIKLFEEEDLRDEVYAKQELFLEHGYAPELGEKVDIMLGVEQRYGYITERVEVLCNPDWPYTMLWADQHPEEARELEDLNDWLCENVAEIDDMHAGNWGIKNGEYIPIDFGG